MCSQRVWLQERWFHPDADIARRPGEQPQPGCQVRRFLPFGDGSRKCIGGELGRVSLTATLARVIGNFRFSLADKVRSPVLPPPPPVHGLKAHHWLLVGLPWLLVGLPWGISYSWPHLPPEASLQGLFPSLVASKGKIRPANRQLANSGCGALTTPGLRAAHQEFKSEVFSLHGTVSNL